MQKGLPPASSSSSSTGSRRERRPSSPAPRPTSSSSPSTFPFWRVEAGVCAESVEDVAAAEAVLEAKRQEIKRELEALEAVKREIQQAQTKEVSIRLRLEITMDD